MKRIPPTQIAQKRDLLSRYEQAKAFLDLAIGGYNAQLEEMRHDVESHADAYNQVVDELNQFIEDIHEAQEEYFDARSDKWRAEEQGDAYSTWMAEWDRTLDSYDPDYPEGLEEVEPEDLEDLADLPV